MDTERLVNKLEKYLVKHGNQVHDVGTEIRVIKYNLSKGSLRIELQDIERGFELGHRNHTRSLYMWKSDDPWKYIFQAQKHISGNLTPTEDMHMPVSRLWCISEDQLSNYYQNKLTKLVR